MTARIIDGQARAARLRAEVSERVAALKAQTGIVPGLAVVLVGDDPASRLYVGNKVRHTNAAGMRSTEHRLPETASESDLLAIIASLNADPAVHGILVQLPLPPQMNRTRVINAINPEKDVDGFHVQNVGRLVTAQPGIVPCTPKGCLMLLEDELGNLRGKTATVIGCSHIVGRPLIQLLLQRDCTVLVAHRYTEDLPAMVSASDIVIAAAGHPGLVRGHWIKPGAVVLDVGINRVPDQNGEGTRIVGDIAFDEALERARAITPVPGGVGPMTIACLLENTVDACCRQIGFTDAAHAA